MTDNEYEKLLAIKTDGEQKIFNESLHYHRYEPTSYNGLDTLCQDYEIKSTDSIIDFGCGKGRLNFYLNYNFNCTVTGIEMNNYFYAECIHNKNNYLKSHKHLEDKINFLNCFAQEYEINDIDNKFYFFNPFSVQIFIKVVGNILDSVDRFYRPVDIILFYPSEDYIYYLENNTAFTLKHEIRLNDLYKNDNRQVFLVYRLDYSDF